jgi:hypothetical protein
MFKMWSRNLSNTFFADFIQKKSVKLFTRVKMYVPVTNVHALVRGLQNRTRQTFAPGTYIFTIPKSFTDFFFIKLAKGMTDNFLQHILNVWKSFRGFFCCFETKIVFKITD